MKEFLSFYSFVVGIALMIGIGEELVTATKQLAGMAAKAHAKGPITFGELNKLFLGNQKDANKLPVKRITR